MVAVPYQKVHIGGKIEVAKRTQEARIKERVSSQKKRYDHDFTEIC
jgi:hypothetical protein